MRDENGHEAAHCEQLRLRKDIEQAFSFAYLDWLNMQEDRYYCSSEEDDWSLIAYACGCTNIYRQVRETWTSQTSTGTKQAA